jgi:predicted membrane channel-forming protein YqfA (hemolysin III family)
VKKINISILIALHVFYKLWFVLSLGFLFEGTGSYTIPFLVAGGFLVISGVMCYPLNIVKNWEDQRNKLREKEALANA